MRADHQSERRRRTHAGHRDQHACPQYRLCRSGKVPGEHPRALRYQRQRHLSRHDAYRSGVGAQPRAGARSGQDPRGLSRRTAPAQCDPPSGYCRGCRPCSRVLVLAAGGQHHRRGDIGFRRSQRRYALLDEQAAKKDSYASLRSIASLQTYPMPTPTLVDFSRASPLSLFEQPAIRVFRHPARLD